MTQSQLIQRNKRIQARNRANQTPRTMWGLLVVTIIASAVFTVAGTMDWSDTTPTYAPVVSYK